VATASTSAARPDQPGGVLADGLIALAGTPDDDSSVPALLRSITQFAADLLPPVTYASVTVRHEDAYTTVAMSSDVALAVDEAQYADQAGPCLDTLRTSAPTALPRIDATVSWPRFRDVALRLGLRASLSIPLFAGRGLPIAALNLYGHDTATMEPLCRAVAEVYHRSSTDSSDPRPAALGPGEAQLVDGLISAFAVRATIQQALGVIMAAERRDADSAYAILRSRAAAGALSLTTAAGSVLARTGDEHS
jgi:hypothetical protein